MADDFKFRIDHHGSLVRPTGLMEARRRGKAGAIDEEEMRAAEQEAVTQAVWAQKKLYYTVTTDGDFPRDDIRSSVFDAVEGFRETDGADAYGRPRWVAESELKVRRPLVADWVSYIREHPWTVPKVNLPSPAWLAAQTFDPGGPWKSVRELGEEIARIIRDEIQLAIDRGARLVQINDFAYARHLSPGRTPYLSLDDCIALDSAAVEGLNKPEDVRVGLCPTHSAKGEVDTEAAARVFAEVPVDRWVLPFCKGTEGEMDLLRAVPADRDACLGVVSPRTAELEDIDAIVARMDAAAEVKDIDDLAVSPSEGFSDQAGRAVLSEDEQRRKLVHVETVARMCWGNEL
ncbi:hypothetical protein [Nocardiopsis sp. LOL_012]|uniref:hypothetical protein n=1 Tax=Nocardiopsis sp. LOL_012 TaxID=3345409 RepID=UPI003A84583D